MKHSHLARRAYSLLLRVFPEEYRNTRGQELCAFFDDAYADAMDKGGMLGAWSYFGRAAWDVLRHGIAQRWFQRGHTRAGKFTLASIRQDVVYGFRSLRRTPGFAIVAIATVGLGVGANTAMFSVVNTVMLKPLPFSEPERLVTVWEANAAQGMTRMSVSYPNYLAWVEQQRSFISFGAMSNTSVLLRGDGSGEAERVTGLRVTSGFFDVLQEPPALGRGFQPDDQVIGAEPVTVISYSLWQSRFGGDPDVIGRPLRLVGGEATIVGVMPATFAFPDGDTQLWLPIVPDDNMWRIRAAHLLTVVARLAPDVTLEQAAGDMRIIATRVQGDFPGEDPAHTALVQPLDEVTVEDVRVALWVLLGAVGTVLLIACVNVANLFLARATSRRREVAMRVALGASRSRVARQLLTEGMVLATIAGATGLALSVWIVRIVANNVPREIPHTGSIDIDGTVLVVTLCVSLITGLLFSVLPALHASRTDVIDALKRGQNSAGTGAFRSRQALVVVEVALSCVLVIGAALLINSFWRVIRVDPGFDVEHMLTMTITLNGTGFETADEVVGFYRALPDRIQSIPNVLTVSAVNALPVSGGDSRGSLTIDGQPFPDGTAPTASYRRVLPGYFEAMGIPVVLGREFEARDDGTGDYVTIIDRAMADRFWPGESPVGKRIKVGPPEHEPWLTVVGVVGNVHNEVLHASNFDTYEPHSQRPWSTMNLIVRTTGDANVVAASIRQALFDINPNVAVYGTNTMNSRIRASLAARRFQTTLLGVFAGIALFMAMVGIYGVMSYVVAQRESEMGIRIALGATTRHVRASVLRSGVALAASGTLLGIMLSAIVTRSISSFVFGVNVMDPLTILVVSVVVMVVAVAATLGPAHRATRIDPVELTRRT